MRKDPVKTLVHPTFTKKTITIRPNKDNQLFTKTQIKEYCQRQMQKLKFGDKMLVTGLNILRNSTLKEYQDDFMDDEAWENYLSAKAVKDRTKYDKFYEFTITIIKNN